MGLWEPDENGCTGVVEYGLMSTTTNRCVCVCTSVRICYTHVCHAINNGVSLCIYICICVSVRVRVRVYVIRTHMTRRIWRLYHITLCDENDGFIISRFVLTKQCAHEHVFKENLQIAHWCACSRHHATCSWEQHNLVNTWQDIAIHMHDTMSDTCRETLPLICMISCRTHVPSLQLSGSLVQWSEFLSCVAGMSQLTTLSQKMEAGAQLWYIHIYIHTYIHI